MGVEVVVNGTYSVSEIITQYTVMLLPVDGFGVVGHMFADRSARSLLHFHGMVL